MTTLSSPPPLAAPTGEAELLDWLRLIRSRRVGTVTFYRLLREHGSAAAALIALPEVARAAGVPRYTPCPLETAQAELAAGRKAGARLIAIGSADYPAALQDLPDPPPLIWLRGQAQVLQRPMLALVGARNASSLGLRMARKLAGDLSEAGFVTVSGLARGVDTACHEASVKTGTVAVLAGGVDVTYPKENQHLAGQIVKTGALISEQPIGLQPMARHFPRRNRLISGLARAVLVIEAAARSGSLITARNALDQGREVLAVPGHPFDARAGGCNLLIRDGAQLIRSAEDVIELIGAAKPAPTPQIPSGAPQRPQRDIQALHQQILNRLGPSPLAEDQLIRDLAMSAGEVTPELVSLELEGRIERQSGGMVSLKS